MPVLDRASIDPDADRVVRKLARNGYKAYLVGGCVRDLLVGRRPKDFDVATSATPNEIRATFRNCRIIGRRFRLAHVFFGSKIIETSTFRANPRDEDDRHDLLIRRDNVFGNETEDALRRDFTINGLFYDVEREEVIDHVGGLRDLDAKLVRTIGDPDIRFQEDPVRMLRALKFAARLDFTLEPATYRALLRWRGEISKCAPPRVLEEIYRLLRGGAARRSFELLVETGTLSVMSPHLAGLLQGDGAPVSAARIDEAPGTATVARVEYDELDPAERDVDDPAHDATGDDDEDVQLAARELDEEEQAWHRVWFDEAPRLPPAAPAPVHITGIGEGKDLARRRARAWQMLQQLDLAVAAERDPANAVAVAAVLTAFMPDEAGRQNEQTAVYELSQPLVTQLHVTRRDSERLRYLLTAQRRLLAARKRGAKPELFGSRDLIDDANELVNLLAPGSAKPTAPAAKLEAAAEPDGEGPAPVNGEAAATGVEEAESAVEVIDLEAGEGDEGDDGEGEGGEEGGAGEPRKRRRRRRGGRRHRGPAGPGGRAPGRAS